MSYHVESPRFGFKELPDRILVCEDGAYGASKEHGEPIIDYWYVPEQNAPQVVLENRIDELYAELGHVYLNRDMWHDRAEDMRNRLSVAQAENEKLRELCADLMSTVCSDCHEKLCEMPKEEHPFVECLFDCRMRELGV